MRARSPFEGRAGDDSLAGGSTGDDGGSMTEW
jgi:hypothetical protein